MRMSNKELSEWAGYYRLLAKENQKATMARQSEAKNAKLKGKMKASFGGN